MENNLPQSKPKSSFKFLVASFFVGAFSLLGLVSLYMPRLLTWYFEPPMQMGISCASSIQWALNRLLYAQLAALSVGGVLGFFIGRKLKKY